jgi:hypothetical protein
VKVGGVVALRATVRNPGRAAVAMPTVVVPVPPGFAVAAGVAQRLAKVPGVSKVEDHGDSLAVYLLELGPDEHVTLPYELDAAADCDVLQRPALAYAYYTPDVRGTSAALRLRATPTGAAARGRPALVSLAASEHEEERHQSPAASVWW